MNIINTKDLWDNVLSIDLETDTRIKGLLNNERVIAIGSANFKKMDLNSQRNYKISHKLITFSLFVMDDESDEAEIQVFRKFDEFLKEKRPIVLLGYNIQLYDLPLLAIKLKHFRNNYNENFWNIRNILVDNAHID